MPPDSPVQTASLSSGNDRSREGTSGERTLVPRFALDAADAKIATLSETVVETADTIDRLVSDESLPVPESVREFATSTTEKLRDFGARSGERDASELVAGLQRAAAAHPAMSIGIGATVGAALAALFVRLGGSAVSTTSAAHLGSKRDGRKAKPDS